MAHNQISINFPSKVFKPSQIAFLLTFFLSVCNANSSHSSTHFDSIDRFYDLSHDYFDGMPVEEGGIPLEFSLTKQDEGEGAR